MQDHQHGQGTYYFQNNNKYVGLWFKDYQQGYGEMYYFNGDTYKGNWHEDKRNGKGKYVYASGAYYNGDWKNDKKEGRGFHDWADGSTYDGEWKNNMRSGKGVFKYLLGNASEFKYEKGKVIKNDEVFKKSGCYIATCVYGSYDCPEVWTLRRFRDYKLSKTWYGRLFIKTYYAVSPKLVKLFGKTNWFKKLWKKKLDRMVLKCNEQGYLDTPYDDIY